MRSNEHWPEGFGFKIGGKSPVVIISVQDNSVAQQAGLQPGDQILELNGENVQGLNKEQITLLAKRSTRVPPAIAVISRIRTLELRRRRGRFGFTLRGSGPVYVYDVEERGPAYSVGMRPGDLVLKVNSMNVRHANADQVQQIVEACGPTITVVLIAGSQSIGDGEQPSTSSRYRRARDFYLQMNYVLPRDNNKKAQLIKSLNKYARDRSIEQLAKSLLDVLKTPVERKLLKQIRYLIPKKHKPEYDILVGINSDRPIHQRPHSALFSDSLSRSMDELDMTRTWSSVSSMSSKKRNVQAHPPRIVRVKRGPGSGFGFTLSGDTPVFVKSLDRGSPAEIAKLKPGDHILEINGLNVRGKRHHTVVELLKGSGTYPSLLVQWRPTSVLKHQSSSSSLGSKSGLSVTFDKLNEDGIHRSASVASRASTRTEQLIMSRFPGSDPQGVRALAREFKLQMNRLFTSGEQKYIKQCLSDYKQERNVSKLLDSIEPVLDDPEKLCILHYMSELLPEAEQAEFDKGAAKIFAKQSQDGTVPSFSAADNDVMDILYRVQGMRLSDHPRQRSVIGGSATSPERTDHWPGRGAASQWNSPTRQDLDMVPVRDTNGNTINEEDDEEDELNLGLEELADALLEEDRKKAAAQVNVRADVHGTPLTATTAPRTELQPSPNNDLGGPTKEEMLEDLKSKTKQLDHAQKVISEQQRIIAENKDKGEEKDAGSEPSKKSFPNDLASAVKARNKDEEDKAATAPTANTAAPPPPPPPPPSAAPPPPPPPPPPGPPPPPAVGGAMNVDGAKMTLKRVNWEKLSDVGLENTVWAQLGRNERLDSVIELMELEQNFSTIQKTKETKEKKDEKPCVLNSKKMYNISILLGHLKMSTDEIKSAILSMDQRVLSEAHIRQLLMYAPDNTELQKYKYLAEDVHKMEKADQFSYEMSKIPYYTQRLKAMLFRLQFDDKVDEIKPDLEAVIEASKELRSCDKLQKLLELVLLMGNYMNKGNMRIAGAQGFKITYLTKLNSTKTTDNKSTLLNFLVQKIEDKCPEVLTMKDNLTTIPVAAKVSGQMVASEIQDLSRRMKAIQDDLISFQATNIQSVDDRFTDVVIDIIEETEGKLEELLDLQKTMNTEFKQTVTFFGETLSKTTTEDFFAIFASFLVHFESAIAQNTNKKKLKDEQAKREQRSKLFKELKQRSQSTADDDDTAKDELMKSLDQRKAKVLESVEKEPQNHEQIKPKIASNNLEASSSSQLFVTSQDEKNHQTSSSPKPVVPSKPVSQTKPVSPVKPMSPTKPVIPVKPVPKKTPPPPPKPKSHKNDSNNNAQIRSSTGTPPGETHTDSVTLNQVEMKAKEETIREIPRGFSNIVSAFETSSKNVDAVYAKPDKTKKSVKAVRDAPPDVPPKLFAPPPDNTSNVRAPSPDNTSNVRAPSPKESTAHSPSPMDSVGDEITGLPYTKVLDKPHSPRDSLRTPSSKGFSVALSSSTDSPRSETADTPYLDQEAPTLKTSPLKESMYPPSPRELPTPETTDSPKAPGSPYIDPGPPNFKPPPPPVNNPPIGEEQNTLQPKQQRGISPPPDFKSVSSKTLVRDSNIENDDHLGAKKSYSSGKAYTSMNTDDDYSSVEVDKSYSSVDVVSSIPSKPVKKYSDYEEVIPRGSPPPLKVTKESPPPKPAPYKGSGGIPPPKPPPYTGTDGIPPPPEYSTADDHMIVGSPRFPVTGSPRLSSAQLMFNALNSKTDNQDDRPPEPPTRTSSARPSDNSPVISAARPPPPPRTTSIKDSPDGNIDDLIARALSPDMKPEYDLDDIPVRDTGPSVPPPPPPAFGSDSVPPLDLSSLGRPPSPPQRPPPSLPIDTSSYDLPSPSSDHMTRLNGFKDDWDDELQLTPPLPPSNKYGLDGNMKPLVPPLRKQR